MNAAILELVCHIAVQNMGNKSITANQVKEKLLDILEINLQLF